MSPSSSLYAHPLVLVRHGVTAWNLADRYQGTTDTLLHQAGRDQALVNGRAIEALDRAGRFDRAQARIVTSPLARARQSAAIISKRLQLTEEQIHIDPAFREIDMGHWEGLTNMEVKDRFHAERKSRKTNRWAFAPQGGESLADRAEEVAAAMAGLPPHSIIVAHAGILRIVMHVMGGMDREEAGAASVPHEGLLHFDGKQLQHLFHER